MSGEDDFEIELVTHLFVECLDTTPEVDGLPDIRLTTYVKAWRELNKWHSQSSNQSQALSAPRPRVHIRAR